MGLPRRSVPPQIDFGGGPAQTRAVLLPAGEPPGLFSADLLLMPRCLRLSGPGGLVPSDRTTLTTLASHYAGPSWPPVPCLLHQACA